MKIGFVVEGSDRHAGDVHAVREFCKRIADVHGLNRTSEVIPGGSKRQILEKAADHVTSLRNLGCARVILIWDNCPPWSLKTAELDQEQFLWAVWTWRRIKNANLPTAGIDLICTRQELEAWILTDGAAITRVLKSIRDKAGMKVKDAGFPERVHKPKVVLQSHWYEHFQRAPYGTEYAALVRECNLAKVRGAPSFQRFEDKVR